MTERTIVEGEVKAFDAVMPVFEWDKGLQQWINTGKVRKATQEEIDKKEYVGRVLPDSQHRLTESNPQE